MNYESSFGGIIRIIIWILIISFIIRLVARLALPHVMRKAEESFRNRADAFQNAQRPSRQEGEISIEKPKNGSKKSSNIDFTDYEEIKD